MASTSSNLRPAMHKVASNVYEPVELRMDSTPCGSMPPITIPELFERTVKEFPENPALSFKDESMQWQTVTYRQYKDKVYHIAKTFIKLGLQPHNTVAVLAFNCPQWFYSELGAIYAGGIFTGVYLTDSPEAVYHVLSTSKTRILVVDDEKQMKKVREIWTRLPDLKAVVQINGPFETDISAEEGYYRWSELESMDTSEMEAHLQSRINNIAVNECCMVMYTSGTVGFPKGVMLSHDNITWELQQIEERTENVVRGQESVITYLPMNHMAAQMGDVFEQISIAGCVYFADRDALKGLLSKTIQQVHPTRFVGVPRVYEKMYEQFMMMESQLPIMKRALLRWARNSALNYYMSLLKGNSDISWQYKLAKYLVINKIKHSIGFDQIRVAMVGAAPLSKEVKKFFMSIDVPLTEAYGMTEVTAGHCMVDRNVPNLATVGKPLHGIDTKIFNPDATGVGEICLKARSIFMGYLNDPEKTRETIDEDGWLHTGDLGKIDDEGYVYIVGRLKELIITAGGENIPPVHVENLVKAQLPIVSNAVLIGDQRKYLTMLLTLKVEIDPDTAAPTDRLLPKAKEWLLNYNLSYSTASEILEAGPCPQVLKAIQEGIARANENAISNAQKVQKFALLPHDFSIATEELGPTLKLRRNVVIRKYASIIENLYK